MSTIDIILPLLPMLTPGDLCTVMAAGAELLSKSTKGAKAAPRAKGAVPPQLQKNKEWVEFVFAVAQERGWEAFEAKDGVNTIECEASVDTEEGPRFEDGSEINMKLAMSLAKHLKDNSSELWDLFSADYEEANPKEEVAAAAAAPVRRTRQQISEEAAAKRLVKEAEMAERKRVREEAAATKAAAKEIADAEKEAKKAAKEAEKEAKESSKAAKLPSASAANNVARLVAQLTSKKTKEEPVAAVAAVAAEEAVEVVEPVVAAPKVSNAMRMAALLAKSAKWTPPKKGVFKALTLGGKKYLANHLCQAWEAGENDGEMGEWAGLYIVAENRIDDSAEEPMEEDNE